ncbi:MAG: hypothetical protein ACRYFU_12365 [Janthinobacterium lividum]
MGPVQYDLGDQDVVAFSQRILQLFEQALPDPSDRTLFDRLMIEARGQGLSWAEGLEYTIQRRRTQCQG